MTGIQLRIFVPIDAPKRWSDILIDRLIRPIVNSERLEWFWFTRYHCINRTDDNDCNWNDIPRGYKKFSGDDLSYETRSVRFRFSVKSNVGGRYTKNDNVEKEIENLCLKQGYWFSDFRAYDPLKDLGSATMLNMCQSACQVVLENLDGNGRIKSPEAFHNLEEMHHRICNIAHITDFRRLGFGLVMACLSDIDNYTYDFWDRGENPVRTTS